MRVDGVIRTQLKEQLAGADDAPDERGVRAWRTAELVGECWFLVEHCFDVDGVRTVRRWIATSVGECERLLSADGAEWSCLFAYLRVPFSSGPGFVFDEVTEIHEVGSEGRLLFRFLNGATVLMPHQGRSVDAITNPEELRPVFQKRPFARWRERRCAEASSEVAVRMA